MRLKHLRIKQVRQFRNSLLLDDLQPGLNLIHGPNESGKSTLVRAIRAAFFERYRSKSVKDLSPWGDSSAEPEIELAFEHNHQQWQLNKRFLKRHRCDLVVDGDSSSGEDAEDKLAALLGYQFARKGASKDEHWGIPGLLWVEQGSGQEIAKAVEYAGDHLQSALNNLVGEVASSGGDDVIRAVEQQRSELLTSTGRPRGEYQQLQADQNDLTEKTADLEQRIAKYRDSVDRLGGLSGEYEKASRERPWEEARRNMKTAEERYQSIKTLQTQQQRDEKSLDSLQQNLILLQQRETELNEQSRKLQQREQEDHKAYQRLTEEEARSPAINAAIKEAVKTHNRANEAVRQARLHDNWQRLKKEIGKLEDDHTSVQQKLDKAKELQVSLDTARKQKQQNQIESGVVKHLKATQRDLDETKIRSQTIATRISWELRQGKTLQINDDQLETQGERLLLDESRVEIPGIGTLNITPGGEDLGSLRRKLEHLEQSLADELKQIGMATVEAAEACRAKCQEAEVQILRLHELSKSYAPNGIDRLMSDHQEIKSELASRKAEVAALSESRSNPDEAPQTLSDAESDLVAAESQLSQEEARKREHEPRLLEARHGSNSARQEWNSLKEELESPERQKRVRETTDDVATANKQFEALKKTIEAGNEKIREARPDIVQQDIARFKATAENQEKAQQNRALELREIRARLEEWGAEGLEEQYSETQADLERVSRRYDELNRRANALDLLLRLLSEKRQALTRRLQAPLQTRLDHYLTVLFPDASLEVDERLVPGKFTRGNELGQMTELSFGAREQMGLISRLAYADLLQEAGRPTLIILDDTLVHSDADRLAGMKRILFDAATRHQILLFTCHPGNWQDLGVEPRDLQALKA